MIEKIFGFFVLSLLLGLGVGAIGFFASSPVGAPGGAGSFIKWAFFGVASVLLLLYLIYGWYVKLYIKRYYYDCDENFVTIQKGVFMPTEIHVQYGKIQDVYVDQDFLDRLIGIYDVHIASATYSSGIAAHIDGVDPQIAEGLKNFLLNKIKGGGNPAADQVSGVPMPPRPQAQLKAVSPTQQISSDQFPISGKWLFLRTFTYLFYAAFISWIINSWFFASGKNSGQSLAEIMGFNPTSFDIFLFWLATFFIFYSFRIIWLVLWRKSYRFEFLPEYILLRNGVISREERHLPYHTIQNVTVSQSFMEKIFGMCTVMIQNAAVSGMVAPRSFVLGQGGNILANNGIQIPGQNLDKGRMITETLNSIISQTVDNRSGL